MKHIDRLLWMVLLFSISLALSCANRNYKGKNDPVIIMKTSMGDITLRLYPLAAPKTVENFLGLASGEKEYTDASGQKRKGKYYDGLIFHRVMTNFMIQGGDILGNGLGGPGYRFEDEISAEALGVDKLKGKDVIRDPRHAQYADMNAIDYLSKIIGYRYQNDLPSIMHKKGVISMANSGPGTNGSQFFITVADTSWLNGWHTCFGEVIQGMDVVEKISLVPVHSDGSNRPLEDVRILSIEMGNSLAD